MKKFLLAAVILFSITCAGCFKVNFNLSVAEDGSVNRTWRIMGTAPFSRYIEDARVNNEKIFPNLQVKTLSEGDMLGYEFALKYPDIETFAKSYSEMYSGHYGKNKGISRRKGWFFDEYDFDFYCASTPADIPPEARFVNQEVFDSAAYDVTIQLPNSAESHNADKFDAAQKVLTWNLTAMIIHGGERHMNARFKLWHKDKIFLTAIIELLLLAATIFFFRKARADEFKDLSKDFCFKRNVFAGLFIALAIISAYMIFVPVTFTDADIISAAQ